MQVLVEAVIRSTRYREGGPRVSAWDLRLEPAVRLLVATDEGVKRLTLTEPRLRRYARRFDFERARRWLLRAIRHAPAA